MNFYQTSKRGIKADGIIYLIENDGQTLTAYKDNAINWSVNIIKSCGKPTVGKPQVRYMKLSIDKIELVIGKHDHVIVYSRDGNVKCKNSD